MKSNVDWKILAGLLIAIFFMAGIGVDSYHSIHQSVDNTRRASEAGIVRRNGRDILVTMLNLETGARGFVITGEDIYLGASPANDMDNWHRQRVRIRICRRLVFAHPQ